MSKKLFAALLATETNTFCPFPTIYEDFEGELAKPIMDKVCEASIAHGYPCECGLVALAMPAGKTAAGAWEKLKNEFMAKLKTAMPVDGIVLCLHGAMVAENCDDCEGELLKEIRNLAGPDVVIGVGLDLHAHHTDIMMENADFLIYFKEWPHTDFEETMLKTLDFTIQKMQGKIEPVMSVFDCRMAEDTFPTQSEPMKSFVADMRAAEEENGILNVSLVHGFAYADVADMGVKVIVITDSEKEKGDKLAARLGHSFFDLRFQTGLAFDSIKEGVEKIAMAREFPVAVGESFDIPGGGAPGDSAIFIMALLEKGITGVAYAYLWDPIAVHVAKKAGEGVTLDMRIGGRIGPLSGDPLDVKATVVHIFNNFKVPTGTGRMCVMGDTAVLDVAGNLIAVTTEREIAIESNHFESLGIIPEKQRALVVKSANNFYAGYTDVAKEFIFINGPGVTGNPFETWEHKKMKRPKWPLDDIQSPDINGSWSGAR